MEGASQPMLWEDVSSAEAFWASLGGGAANRPVEHGWLLAVLWATGYTANEDTFGGKGGFKG